MRMSLDVVIAGGLLVFAAVLGVAVILPDVTISEHPSHMYRPRSALEDQGREIFIANGCTYCHSQYIRTLDWDLGAERIAQSGDYVAEQPHLLGTERTGPDLSQEGGEHPDDWHAAHFFNPRHTRPDSLMPPFAFLEHAQTPICASLQGCPPANSALLAHGQTEILIGYVQSLGYRNADYRVDRQKKWKQEAIRAFESGTDANIKWLHDHVPDGWRRVPNPYFTTPAGIKRGQRIFQSFCIGCHSPVGDGMGPAAKRIYPPPLNFTTLKGRGVTGGILYYQIMNGITGTAMPYFKRELESEKIWDVGNYVAVYFIGETDAGGQPRGIGAAYEGPPPKQETE